LLAVRRASARQAALSYLVRKKAKELGVKARTAVEKGGSSYNEVGQMMDGLMAGRSFVKVGVDEGQYK
jgi:hypothetical protein